MTKPLLLVTAIFALLCTTGCDSKTRKNNKSEPPKPSASTASASTQEARPQTPPEPGAKSVKSPQEALAAVKALADKKKAAPVEVDPNFQSAPPADAKKTASGLAYKVVKAGTGKTKPKGTDHVTVHYTGWTTDGKEFDSSVKRGKPAQFPLNGVIKGWTEGLQLMVEGEKTRFWIPANLAYGEKPAGGRPAGLLIFDVELLGIKPPPDPIKLAETLKSKACACKDLPCLQGLREDGMAMAMAMRSATPEQRTVVTKLQADAKACVDKLVSGAGLSGANAGPLPKTPLMDKAKGIKDQICACKDQACVAKVSQGMAAMRSEFAKATDEEKAGMQRLGIEIGKCIQKLMPKPAGPGGGLPPGAKTPKGKMPAVKAPPKGAPAGK